MSLGAITAIGLRDPPPTFPLTPMPSLANALEQLAQSFEQEDYRRAAAQLKVLMQQAPKEPWVQFYLGRLHEVSNRLEKAEVTYRQLLRQTTHPKIIAQTRQGLQRLADIEKQRRQAILDAAMEKPGSGDPGVLILEPIDPNDRADLAKKLSQIVQTDPYSARQHMPHRGWRMYRTGTVGELEVFSNELSQASIPNFHASLPAMEEIHIFQVNYLQTMTPQATAICRNELDQLGTIVFDWSEVSQCVEGFLPIFEQVVDEDPRHRLIRKVQVQDYTHLYDLHLPGRKCILRFRDGDYQFLEDKTNFPKLTPRARRQATTRINWNQLLEKLKASLEHAQVADDFTPFAETVLDYPDLLNRIEANINLLRRDESLWDPAFQLYSTLVFYKAFLKG